MSDMNEEKVPFQARGKTTGTQLRLAHAMQTLQRRGVLKGVRSRKMSVRVDPGLLEEARARSGVKGDSDLVNAALALMAAPNDFGIWLLSQRGSLSKDFEPAI